MAKSNEYPFLWIFNMCGRRSARLLFIRIQPLSMHFEITSFIERQTAADFHDFDRQDNLDVLQVSHIVHLLYFTMMKDTCARQCLPV